MNGKRLRAWFLVFRCKPKVRTANTIDKICKGWTELTIFTSLISLIDENILYSAFDSLVWYQSVINVSDTPNSSRS